MGALAEQIEAIKAVLKSGNASQTTVITLQTILASENGPIAENLGNQTATSKKPVSTSNVSSRTKKPSAARPRKGTETVFVDSALASRDKYVLATDVVNIALKVLTGTLQVASSLQKALPPAKDGSPAPSTPSPSSRRVLQPVSGNATPSRTSPEKRKDTAQPYHSYSNSPKYGAPPHIVATGECACLSFAYLCVLDIGQPGLRQMPKLQLETAMLALVGKLINHGLDVLATKELRVLKRRLSMLAISSPKKPAAAKSGTEGAGKETLACLLHFDANFETYPEALPLAITYQLHVLRLILTAQKPFIIEAIIDHLEDDSVNSPSGLILRQVKLSGDTAKAAKQLETLSQAILAFCPSTASSADATATDPKHHPSPDVTLRLQLRALQIRKMWWSMAKHKPDISKELLEPISKSSAAFLRRTSASLGAVEAYNVLVRSTEKLGLFESTPALFGFHNLLCSLAERAKMKKQALCWAEEMVKDCSSLDGFHAKKAACLLKRTSLSLQAGSKDQQKDFEAIQEHLHGNLTGSNADYDILLSCLPDFTKSLFVQKDAGKDVTLRITLMSLAATFAQRYSRSYPGKGTQHIQNIVSTALHFSDSTEDLLRWITEETARISLQGNASTSLAKAAATQSLQTAWSTCNSAVLMSRILRTLLLRAVRSSTETASAGIFDDDQLQPPERGIMLELQLKYAIELSPKTKYHNTLRNIIPDILSKLSNLYTPIDYPIRRTRVAITALQLCLRHPHLLPANIFASWDKKFDLDASKLGHDRGLKGYFNDIKASMAVAKAFSSGRPTTIALKPHLAVWHQIIENCETLEALADHIENHESTLQQLKAIVAYFEMLGEDAMCIAVQRLLLKLRTLRGDEPQNICADLTDLARHYLALGYSEKGGVALAQAEQLLRQPELDILIALQYRVEYADYLLAIDNVEKCLASLDDTRNLRIELPPEKVSRDQRKAYELLHARGWLVQSKYMLEAGSPHEALGSAKRAVKILNSIWSSIERAHGNCKPNAIADIKDPLESEMSGLTRGISKLQLEQAECGRTLPYQSNMGAAFWPVVRLLTMALVHLSDLFTHHGLFNEANYYSERAIYIAESVGSCVLLTRIKCRRVEFLALAGQIKEAELCLAQDEATDIVADSIVSVERYCARARLGAKEGALKEAVSLYEKAEMVIDSLATTNAIESLENCLGDEHRLGECLKATSLKEMPVRGGNPSKIVPRRAAGIGKKTCDSTRPKIKNALATKRTRPQTNASNIAKEADSFYYCFSKLKANVSLRKALLSIQLEQNVELTLAQIEQVCTSMPGSLAHRRAKFQSLMQQASTALQMDVTLNILAESALSFPAIMDTDRALSETLVLGSSPSATVAKAPTKTIKKNTKAGNAYEVLLNAARDCLLRGYTTGLERNDTSQTHAECAMLSSVSLLLSATFNKHTKQTLHPIREGLAIDQPRMKALECEKKIVELDKLNEDHSDALTWPEKNNPHPLTGITAKCFKEHFIDIIPKSWTAVSLCLSEDCSELYIARYRSGQPPFILRLPFSRHKPDGVDEEAFDYHQGKSELQEIIELSNYSCHNSNNLEAKGAKTNWWSEREALDRRLHELLINIENIWFGGFKAIFSQYPRQEHLLARFRKSFEDILDRYLPSRQPLKGKNSKLALDNKVLELFIGLGHDQDGVIDLDEPLTDLLYFVVDMLQFNGECNAYDEIDFDSMAIDVLDCLRAYHDACADGEAEPQHLILVLDRRLQSFPWECLPYLETANVSRVGSMLSLRERIMAMQTSGCGHHSVNRASGTYILNPSSDLAGTQTTLSPALSSLPTNPGSQWDSIINKAPNEEDFKSALSTQSMMLYFGHGAGSQYIRPRTIKRLEKCSEVVWLMGCSSGAVTEHGELEPCAIPLAYLLAGDEKAERANQQRSGRKCMAVVATLWDVTDKDIDRFSLALGEEWGLWPASEQSRLPAKTPRKREVVVAPSTPQQIPKTPRTPKVRKTPAAKTPARSRGRPREDQGRKQSLVEAVGRSRDACYLRYLNGAAPVVYGVPVYLGD